MLNIQETRAVKMKKQLWFPSGDILYNVLRRLYTTDLVKLKRVSKEWQRVMSERAFIKAQLQQMEPLAGFFYQGRDYWSNDEPDCISYIPVQRSITLVTSAHRDVLSFLPESVTILDSRNGLVCCRSILDPVIYVCNPLNKNWKELQWPNPSKESSIALVFEPLKISIKKLQDFNVVLVSKKGDEHFSFNIYSSATGEWKMSKETCVCKNRMLKKGFVCVQGILYWLLDGDQILMFDLEKDMSCLIEVPIPASVFNLNHDMCLGEAEGSLHFVLMCEDGLQLWVLKDHLMPEWHLSFIISLVDLERHTSLFTIAEKLSSRSTVSFFPWMGTLGTLAFKDKILLLRYEFDFYLYHFETRELRFLCSLCSLSPKFLQSATVFPYTMSLVPLVEG